MVNFIFNSKANKCLTPIYCMWDIYEFIKGFMTDWIFLYPQWPQTRYESVASLNYDHGTVTLLSLFFPIKLF